ncbi:MAG: TonB-dependent receptor [Bacteroidota bacterium]
MKKFLLFIFVCISTSRLLPQTFKGDIVGHISDGKTQEPLPIVNVQVVEQPIFGAVTDSAGNFRIKGISVGTYSLKATIVGYESIILTNIVVSTGRSTKVSIKLNEQAIAVSGVTVQANYFNRSNQLAPLSVNSYDRAEVKRQPGSAMDVQRVIQNLPGIASSTDNMNELIVRGGAPYENLTVMENMEIPSINHYPNQFNSAGPINMVNIDLVEDVQFSSGGFPAQYGDKMSSVMDLSIREGDRNKQFASNTGFNMAGIGTLMEGRIDGGRGSWIFSARQSLLEVIDRIVGMSAISLTAVPKYWDTQTKVVYDLSSTQKLIFNGMFGDSRINIVGDPKEKDSQRAGDTVSSGLQNVNSHNQQYVFGLNLKSLWGKEGYSVLTLYAAGNQYNVDVQEDFTRQIYGPTGEVTNYTKLNTRDVFNNHSNEQYIALKYNVFYQIHPQHDLSLGAQIQTSSSWKNVAHIYPDTMRLYIPQTGTWTGPIVSSGGIINNNLNFGDANKMFAYISDKYTILPRLSLTFGLRYDYFSFSKQGQISPRANIAYEIIPLVTTISLAAGEYWQSQPFPYYSDPQNLWINKELPNAKANHIVLGLQHILDEGVKLSVETYYKHFQNIVVSEQFVYSAIDTFRSDRNLAIGERESYGVEFFLQKKQVTNYYGTISVSLSKTEDVDPRNPKLVDRYPSEYDYPVILNFVGGKIVKGVRSWLNDQPFFIKYPLYILPLSDEIEISSRYRYQTGGPYTPNDFTLFKQQRLGGMIWSQGAWESSNRINSERYPDYSRFDIQWISRFYMQNWNINVYIALMNLFNTKNVFYYEYRSDGTRETVYQFAFFPVGGVEIEF